MPKRHDKVTEPEEEIVDGVPGEGVMVDEVPEPDEAEALYIYNRDVESYTRKTEEELSAEGFNKQEIGRVKRILRAQDKQLKG